MPELKASAMEWSYSKWGVPQEAYLECMNDYLNKKADYGWYLCLDDAQIVGGLGVIENDFHDRKDLSPNVCAVYTDNLPPVIVEAGELMEPLAAERETENRRPRGYRKLRKR